MKILLYLSVFLNLCLANCADSKVDCDNGTLLFNLPLEMYGIKDTISIGDTIRIKLEIPYQLPEQHSGAIYDFVDYDFKLINYIERIDTNPVCLGSKEMFDWHVTRGRLKYRNNHFVVSPSFENNAYWYEALIIPKQKGLFVFGMNSTHNRHAPLAKIQGPCTNNPLDVQVKLVNDTPANFGFLKRCPDPSYQKMDRKRFDAFGGMCFCVR